MNGQIFMCSHACTIPNHVYSVHSHTPSTIVDRARLVFSSLASLTVQQLVPIAKAVILPVMMGVAR